MLQLGNLDSRYSIQSRTVTFGLSKRPTCQEASKWRLRSDGRSDGRRSRSGRREFHAAETTGQHEAANRGGVALAGPTLISSSVPTEFEATLDDAAFMAPEGVKRPVDHLRSRILARHVHAMLLGGVTSVTVYLEPGIRASGLTLWLLETLAAFCMGFDRHGS